MTNRSPALIRPWHAENKSNQELSYLLDRLLRQKGGSLNITEESLEEEIRNGESQTEDSESTTGKDEDEKSKTDQMQVMRTEILNSTK